MGQHAVIVGAGPAGVYAMETLRAFAPEAEITLVSDEPPHARMALPYWLAGQVPREQTLTAGDEALQQLRVTGRFGVRATALDSAARVLTLSDGQELAYDSLLLSLGSRPRRPALPGAELPGVQTMWTLRDTESLLAGLSPASRVCLVGAGFIGLIVLNALWKLGCTVSVVETAPQILPRMLDTEAARMAEAWLASRGIALRTGVEVTRIEAEGSALRVQLTDGTSQTVDRVILSVGVQPNVELAQAAGIQVAGGIRINSRCETSAPGVYAGGDCAAGPDLLTGDTQVHAIQPTAVDHGRVAGANMAGRNVEYPGSLSMNILDVAGLQCVSFGQWVGEGLDTQVLANPGGTLYRKLVWQDGRLVGSMFVGPMREIGLLNDIGMTRGFIQSQVEWGAWRHHLHESPADLRRPYIALGVAQALVSRTLLGEPSRGRTHRHAGLTPPSDPGPFHPVFVQTRQAP